MINVTYKHGDGSEARLLNIGKIQGIFRVKVN